MMSLSMCSDVSGHAESEHSFFFKDRTPQSHHDRDGGGVCGGFVTTPLQVLVLEVVLLFLEEMQIKCLVLIFFRWLFRLCSSK